MNRRQFVAGVVVPMALVGQSAGAQEDVNAELVQRYLNMLTGQNWDDADELLAEDYAPLYPLEDTLPGRDAWKQRQASNVIWGMFDSFDLIPVSVSTTGEYTHILVELRGQRFSGGEAVAPLVGVLTIVDGKITGGHGAIDEAVLFDRM